MDEITGVYVESSSSEEDDKDEIPNDLDKRTRLRSMVGERKLFRGVFERYGKKVSGKRTFLVCDIFEFKDGEKIDQVAEHLWFNVGERISRLGRKLQKGDILQFQARSDTYRKGKTRQHIDVKLKNPSNWKLVQPDGTIISTINNKPKSKRKSKTSTRRKKKAIISNKGQGSTISIPVSASTNGHINGRIQNLEELEGGQMSLQKIHIFPEEGFSKTALCIDKLCYLPLRRNIYGPNVRGEVSKFGLGTEIMEPVNKVNDLPNVGVIEESESDQAIGKKRKKSVVSNTVDDDESDEYNPTKRRKFSNST